MPIYEYICASCGRAFEEFARSMMKGKPPRCPRCGREAGERKPSVFAAREGASRSGGLPAGGPCAGCPDSDGPCPLR